MGDKDKRNRNSIDMLHGPLWSRIIIFALPFMASSVLQQLFNAADIAIVGRFASSQAMAAVGSNTSVIALIVGLFTGMAVGTNVIVARLIGQGRSKDIHDAANTSMSIAIIGGLALIGIGNLVARPLLEVMGTPENVLDQAVLYLRLYTLGIPFALMYNFGSAILRSKGDSRRPLYALMASGVFNVALNMLFVIVFHLGVVGVAVATCIANMISAGAILFMLSREENRFRVRLGKLYIRKKPLMEILRIGIPAGVQGMMFSFSNIILQSAINGFGSDGVAGSAAAQNFEFVSYFVINAFGQAAVTFTSQNFGAGNLQRTKEVFKWCLLFGVIASMFVDVMFALFRYEFIGLFATETGVIEYGVTRMVMVCLFGWIANSYEVVGGSIRGLGYAMVPTVISLIGSCLFRIGWVFLLFPKMGSFESLVIVYPVTWTLTGMMMMTAYVVIRRKLTKKMEPRGE